MNDIQSIGEVATATTLSESTQQMPNRIFIESKPLPHRDLAEIAELTRVLSCFAELLEGRARRIVDIRRAIRNETYVTEEKLNSAMDRLFADL